MKHFIIKEPIYFTSLNVILDCGIKEAEEFCNKKNMDEWVKWKKDGGYVFLNGKHYIWLREFKKNSICLSLLVHEIAHFIFEVMRQVEVKLVEDSEEIYTHLIQYYYSKILNKRGF